MKQPGKLTDFGFTWGPAEVTRVCDWPGRGVFIRVEAKRAVIEVRVTPAGNIIVHKRKPGEPCKKLRLLK